MLATCRHVSPQRRHCRPKIGHPQMLPTPWLDSWLGHVSADVLPHDCTAISTTLVAISPTKVTVIFKNKMVCICELMHMIPFSWLSCTKSCHYCTIFCEALLFFLYVQKNQPTCRQNLGWFLVNMTFGRLGRHFFPNVVPKFSTFCRHADDRCRDNISFGGSWRHNTTPTFPIKLSLSMKS